MAQRRPSSRQRIVDRATHLISLRGLRGMRLEELLDGAGSTKGALFHHFDSKRALALAAVERAEEVWWPVVFAPFPPEAGPWQRVCIMLDRLWDVAAIELWEGGCFFLALGTEVDDQDPELSAAVRRFFQKWQAAIEALVVSGIEAGQFRPTAEPRALAQLIMATGEGGVLLSRLWQDREVYRRILAQLRGSLARTLLSDGAGG